MACVGCWVGAFLCVHVFATSLWGGGCARVYWGWALLDEQARCRVHVQHRVSVCHAVVWWVPACFCWGVVFWWGVCGGLFVICIVVASIFCSVLFFVFCLVLLGIRWMPWHQELMKDVTACDMPRGAGE